MWINPFDGILTNDWLNFVMSNYSGIIAIAVPAIIFILKLAAIIHPGIPSDKIIDLIKSASRGDLTIEDK
jgi:hypothetical protein